MKNEDRITRALYLEALAIKCDANGWQREARMNRRAAHWQREMVAKACAA